MITPVQIEKIAKLLAGDSPGWQARFVKMTGISRSQVSYLVNGERSLTAAVAHQIVDAARKEATALRGRADDVEHQVVKLLLELPIDT
jgi:hypothetical protein